MLDKKYVNYILISIIVFLFVPFIIDFSSKNIVDYYNFLDLDIPYYLDYIYSFLLFSFFILVIFNFNIESKYKKYLLLAYIFRIFFILFIFPFVENYYNGWDAKQFYGNALAFQNGISEYNFSIGNSTANISQIFNILHNLFGFGYKNIEVILSTIVFYAFYLNFKQLKNYLTNKQNKFILIFFLFEPMTIIFTSLYSKDPLAIASIMFSFYFLIKFYRTSKKKYLLYSFIPFIYFLFVRIWLIPIVAISIIFSLFLNKKINKISFLILFVFTIILVFFSLNTLGINSLSSLESFIVNWSAGWGTGGSATAVSINSLTDFIIKYPYLLFTTLFRPLIMTGNIFVMLTNLINWIIFIFFIKSIYVYTKYKNRFNILIRNIYNTALIFIWIWGSAYSFISPQNLGSGTRFKIQIWFLIILISSFGFIKNKDIKIGAE